MHRERVLITVKTYPTLSKRHVELVCTAGLREDGSWIRLYPIPFRLLDQEKRFPKWHWVDLPVVRRKNDHRTESHSPANLEDIQIGGKIGTEDKWRARRELVLGKGTVWKNMQLLIEAAKQEKTSLATFKPTKLIALEIRPEEETDWSPDVLASAIESLRQGDLFRGQEDTRDFIPAEKMPFSFHYRFADENGKESRLKIIDWEIGMLYRNCLQTAHGDEKIALEKVQAKYETDFFKTDLHLFLGTTHAWHDRSKNPWMVIGVMPLPINFQQTLFWS